MFPQPFDPAAVDPDQFARLMQRPAARLRYVIYFTPRTGSSWLTDVATRTGRLSQPGECFNPHFVPAIARRLHAADLDGYVEALVRQRNTHGVFGCQLTYFQLQKTFGSEARFLRHFGTAPCFWLIREDIVLQAVSLAKKQQTKIAHRPAAGAEQRRAAERAFVYDAAEIRRWIKHIRAAETRTEAMIRTHRLAPLRLSYEYITGLRPLDLVNLVAAHIGAPPIEEPVAESDHGKIGTDKNLDFAERFRREHPRQVRKIAAERAPMLAALRQGQPSFGRP